MAKFKIKFYSQSLLREAAFDMFIPNDRTGDIPAEYEKYAQRGTKTLFLLHGYTECADSVNWGLNDMARRYNFAMVMPNAENSFYLDSEATGRKYCTFVGSELVEYIRRTFGLAQTADNTYIMGLSMGGFGALHTALTYPQNFGKTAAMSSALIVHEIAHMKEGEDNGIANYYYYRGCFGDLETVEQREANPEVLVNGLKESGGSLPEMYLCCGTEDFLLENNREFHRFLVSREVPHEYHESRGAHDWGFWGEYSRRAVEWMFAE